MNPYIDALIADYKKELEQTFEKVDPKKIRFDSLENGLNFQFTSSQMRAAINLDTRIQGDNLVYTANFYAQISADRKLTDIVAEKHREIVDLGSREFGLELYQSLFGAIQIEAVQTSNSQVRLTLVYKDFIQNLQRYEAAQETQRKNTNKQLTELSRREIVRKMMIRAGLNLAGKVKSEFEEQASEYHYQPEPKAR